MRGRSGSGPFGVVAHIDWFGQPAQASPLPARLDSGPGQCSVGLVSSLKTSGACIRRTWLRRNKLWRVLDWSREVDLHRFFQGRRHLDA